MVVASPKYVENRFRGAYYVLLGALAVFCGCYFGWHVYSIIVTRNEPVVSFAESTHMSSVPTFAICDQCKQAKWAFAEMKFGKKMFPENKLVPTSWYNPQTGQQLFSNSSWEYAPTAYTNLMSPTMLSDRFSNSSMFNNCILFHPPRRSPTEEFHLEKGQRFLFKAAFESDGSHGKPVNLKLHYLPEADLQEDQGFLTALEPWSHEIEFRRNPSQPSEIIQTEKPLLRTQISIKQTTTETLHMNPLMSDTSVTTFKARQKGSAAKSPSLLWMHPLPSPCQPAIASTYCSAVTDMEDPKLHWMYAKIFIEEDLVSIVKKRGMCSRLATLAVSLGSFLTLAGLFVTVFFVPKYPLSHERRVYNQLTLRFHDSSDTHDIQLPLVDEKEADEEAEEAENLKKSVLVLASARSGGSARSMSSGEESNGESSSH